MYTNKKRNWDLSEDIIQDDDIQRLTSFPNMLLTAHQAFFTNEALTNSAHYI
jgi:D-lactate dehydrogenase